MRQLQKLFYLLKKCGEIFGAIRDVVRICKHLITQPLIRKLTEDLTCQFVH